MPRWILTVLLLPSLTAPLLAQEDTDSEVERVRETWNGVFERSKERGWDQLDDYGDEVLELVRAELASRN